MTTPFDYRKRTDLVVLSVRLDTIPPAQRARFAAAIMTAPLLQAPLWVRLAVGIGRLVRRRPLYETWMAIFHDVPDLVDMTFKSLKKHIVLGRDRIMRDSAGGFCADEIAVLVDLMSAHGADVSPVGGASSGEMSDPTCPVGLSVAR